MTIVETRDMQDVLKLIPMEIEIRNEGMDIMPLKDMLTIIRQWLDTNPDFHALIAYGDSGEIIGYMLFIIKPKSVHLWRVWHRARHPEVGDDFLNILKQAAKMRKIKSITTEMYKNEHLAEYRGFKRHSVIMELTV